MKKYGTLTYPSFSVVGKLHTAVGPLSVGKILRLRDSSTTSNGDICNWEVALATSATDVAGVLGYLIGPMNGAGTAADQDLVHVMLIGQVMQTTGAGAATNQVYVTNTGTLANAAGNNSRKVGQIFASGGGKFDCWFSGIAEAYGPAGISDYSIVTGDLKPPAATPGLGAIVKVPHIDHIHPTTPLVDGEEFGAYSGNRWNINADRLAASESIRREKVAVNTGATAIDATSHLVLLDATGGTFSQALPAVVPGLWLTLQKVGSDTNKVTITPSGGQTINGQANYVFRFPGESIDLLPDTSGTNWLIVSSAGSQTDNYKAVADVATADATPTEIWSHEFPELTLQSLNIQVFGQTADSVSHAEFVRNVRLHRLGGSPPDITQNAVPVPDTNTTDWAITIDINGNTLRVRVTGHAAVNVAWRIFVDGVQLG